MRGLSLQLLELRGGGARSIAHAAELWPISIGWLRARDDKLVPLLESLDSDARLVQTDTLLARLSLFESPLSPKQLGRALLESCTEAVRFGLLRKPVQAFSAATNARSPQLTAAGRSWKTCRRRDRRTSSRALQLTAAGPSAT